MPWLFHLLTHSRMSLLMEYQLHQPFFCCYNRLRSFLQNHALHQISHNTEASWWKQKWSDSWGVFIWEPEHCGIPVKKHEFFKALQITLLIQLSCESFLRSCRSSNKMIFYDSMKLYNIATQWCRISRKMMCKLRY